MSNLAEKLNSDVDVNSTPTPNVVGIYNDSPQIDINNFMKLRNCENTRKTYWKHYSEMFMYITGKQIDQLTWNDINSSQENELKTIEQV
jgi:hypothetical protein